MSSSASSSQRHSAVVLFYKYFQPSSYPLLHKFPRYYEQKILEFQQELCGRLGLKGRVLIAAEGINGTLSGVNREILQEYIKTMEGFELRRDCGLPADAVETTGDDEEERLFAGIDWKESASNEKEGILEPFPDLRMSVVKEIVSSGGAVKVEDIAKYGGRHLSPDEFHEALNNHPDAVLIDVRNTFEHDIGHFVNPNTGEAARNPEMVTFSSFDSSFCEQHAQSLKGRKVLMFCTGGIRCEKASVMLKKRGVEDVSQLHGGIHRYLDRFGSEGYYLGKNFVFDQRVALRPPITNETDNGSNDAVVGKCLECSYPFDEISGSRLCTVCRDLVLICPQCESKLREYHCRRHQKWKNCYFTFLEIFDVGELRSQQQELLQLRETYVPASRHKNVRRTISRQIEKVKRCIEDIENGTETIDRNAPRRCRTCMEPNTLCDGRCFGFWKTQRELESKAEGSTSTLLPVSPGDIVEPGLNWNPLRFGPKTHPDGSRLRGKVIEVKCWGSGGTEKDCAVVCWDHEPGISKPYRWGAFALNGVRMYDLQRVQDDLDGQAG